MNDALYLCGKGDGDETDFGDVSVPAPDRWIDGTRTEMQKGPILSPRGGEHDRGTRPESILPFLGCAFVPSIPLTPNSVMQGADLVIIHFDRRTCTYVFPS